MAGRSTTAKPRGSAKNAASKPECKHTHLLPSGVDQWTCKECDDVIKMTDKGAVDSKGKRLEIELDGKTGGVKGLPEKKAAGKNGAAKEPEQIELVRLSTEDIIHNMTMKQAEINIAASEAGRARKRVKDLKEQQQKMIDELMSRDALEHNMQLSFGGADEEDDDD